MIEYGNYFHREDVWVSGSNYIDNVLTKIRIVNNSLERRSIIHQAVMTLLSESIREHGEGRANMTFQDGNTFVAAEFVYNSKVYYYWEMYRGDVDSNVKERIKSIESVFQKVGTFGEGLRMLWEDDELFPMTSLIKASLEFPVMLHLMNPSFKSYVLYSTDCQQRPMTETFKNRLFVKTIEG